MSSTLASGPVVTAVLAALRLSVSLTGYVGARIYPDDNGDVPQKPDYPYISVESAGEPVAGMNTLGPVDALKWGSIPRVHVRVGSRSRSDAQANAISGLVKQALDGRALTVTGYRYAEVGYVDVQPLRDMQGGVTIREWVNQYDVTVHQ